MSDAHYLPEDKLYQLSPILSDGCDYEKAAFNCKVKATGDAHEHN